MTIADIKVTSKKRLTYPIIYAYSTVIAWLGLASYSTMAKHIITQAYKWEVSKPTRDDMDLIDVLNIMKCLCIAAIPMVVTGLLFVVGLML